MCIRAASPRKRLASPRKCLWLMDKSYTFSDLLRLTESSISDLQNQVVEMNSSMQGEIVKVHGLTMDRPWTE